MLRFGLLAGLVGGCAPGGDVPPGHCRATVWAQPQRSPAELELVGSWDDWQAQAAFRRFDATWWVAEPVVPPGTYGYLVIEEEAGRLDDFNPLSTFRQSDGLEVSLLEVADCSVPQLSVERVAEGEVHLRFTSARDGAPLDPESITVDGAPAKVRDVADDTITVAVDGRSPGKHQLELAGSDLDGLSATPRSAALWVDPRAPQRQDEIVYQVVIDRFRGDGGTALPPPPNPGARAGGTIEGVRAELEAGTFDALAVSTLWLSPVYTNPDEPREGADGNLYEGYHGYWPLDSRGVDPRIGGEAALHALVDAAHAKGIRVVLDLVPNHLYESNPRAIERAGQQWFHDPGCICGTPSCPWSRFIQTCWFTPYLPDLRFQTAGVVEAVVDDAVWWKDTFNVDGFRIDAVPMMPRAVSRRIVHATRTAGATLHIGEIFTGPGTRGTETIRFYLGPDGLDSAFDFPLMWALRSVVASGDAGFDELEAVLSYTDAALEGSGSPPSLILGNHDTTRFASVAHGDEGRDPWGTAVAEQPDDPSTEVYQRQALGLGLILTLPGIPTIYYGDEVGLAGGGDPDSRRVFPAGDGLLPAQEDLLERVRRVAQLRRCAPALRRGGRVPLLIAGDHYGFARTTEDGAVAVVVASRASSPTTARLPANSPHGTYVDALSGDVVAIGASGGEVPMAPLSLRVLLPQGDACVL